MDSLPEARRSLGTCDLKRGHQGSIEVGLWKFLEVELGGFSQGFNVLFYRLSLADHTDFWTGTRKPEMCVVAGCECSPLLLI